MIDHIKPPYPIPPTVNKTILLIRQFVHTYFLHVVQEICHFAMLQRNFVTLPHCERAHLVISMT